MLWRQPLASKRFYIYHAWKLLFCVFPLIVGCAAFSTKSTVVRTIITQPATHTEYIIPAKFNLTGRISIQDDQQRISGGIRWQHTEMTDEVLLLSPLGQVMAHIARDHEGVRLTTTEQKIFYAADVESLTEDILGWRIPLTGLQYWAQGLHSPVTSSIKDLDENDRVVTIRQDGWEIEYLSYTTIPSTLKQRPRVLALGYESLKIRLVIDNWDEE